MVNYKNPIIIHKNIIQLIFKQEILVNILMILYLYKILFIIYILLLI